MIYYQLQCEVIYKKLFFWKTIFVTNSTLIFDNFNEAQKYKYQFEAGLIKILNGNGVRYKIRNTYIVDLLYNEKGQV